MQKLTDQIFEPLLVQSVKFYDALLECCFQCAYLAQHGIKLLNLIGMKPRLKQLFSEEIYLLIHHKCPLEASLGLSDRQKIQSVEFEESKGTALIPLCCLFNPVLPVYLRFQDFVAIEQGSSYWIRVLG